MVKTNFITILTITVFFIVLCSDATAAENIIYVDDDATGANDGTSWTNAYNFLQDALAAASDGDEIRVAQGVYTPDLGYVPGPDADNYLGIREASFQLTDDITLCGGFAGIGSIDPDARDIEAYQTILSGDLNGNDDSEPNKIDNSLHIMICYSSAVLDGLIITGAYTNRFRGRGNGSDLDNKGGGIYNDGGSPTITNCTFRENGATINGGGMYSSGGKPSLANCTFIGNYAEDNGGGIYNAGSELSLTNCTFTGNSTRDSGGGGIYNAESKLSLTNCTFTENHAGDNGGGICTQSDPTMDNCTFIKNSAGDNGGGICCNNSQTGRIIYENLAWNSYDATPNYPSEPGITNCTFVENTARYGGGMYNYNSNPKISGCTFIENTAHDGGGGIYNRYSSPTLTNCVFTGNSVPDQGGGMCNITKSPSGDSPILRNCLFTGNHSGFRGGGIYNLSCEPFLINCTFAGNWAGEGNALYCKSEQERNTVTLINCILWDFGTEIEIWDNDLSIINVFYSNIRGGWVGEGNLDTDPLFVDQLGPDHKPGTEDDDLRLTPLSPCVDAGDPNYAAGPDEIDLDDNPRIVSGKLDMGAYEFEGLVYVDGDGPYEQWPGEPQIPHLEEDGSDIRPFDTIQEAIDIAKDGYTVLVRPGLYGKIDFKGKAITVTSTEGAAMIWAPPLFENTDDYDAVTFHTGEGRGSVLKNFIIRDSSTAISLNFSSPKIHNVTIVNNDFGISAYENSNPDIRNCILWNNINGDLFQCEAKYSCIESGSPGEGNINVNPLFVDAANGDYHLKSEGWRWNTAGQSWTWDDLDLTSRCIDAGDPCSPLGDEPMSVPRDPNNRYSINRYINMGAFGGTCQASLPPLDWPPAGEDWTDPVPDPAQWAPGGAPREINIGGGTFDYWVQMTAEPATDASGWVEYFFECTMEPGFSSGWQSSHEYKVQVGRSGQGLRFRVKARDLHLNETAWSEERTAH